MFLLYLLWIVVVFGGGFMGWKAVETMIRQGPSLALVLNVVLYWGCAFYGAPKLLRLVSRKRREG